MKHRRLGKALSVLVSLMLVCAFALPVTAFAAKPEVQVDNHAVASTNQTLTKLRIDGVDAPQTGKALDDKATVSSAEGETWDIPVLWISDSLNIATEAAEGHTYLPALVFFVPQGYTVEGATFTVTLSDSLTRLFGSEDVVSVYDAAKGITYILPATLRNFFAAPVAEPVQAQMAASATGDSDAVNTGDEGVEGTSATESAESYGEAMGGETLVEIYCAQTARNAIAEEDLEYIINLVINSLEPQAVNLLIDRFPAFKAAADKQQLGTKIGLYVYYKKGDKDGMPEHESASEALAYVTADSVKVDGKLQYCYLFGLDVDDLVAKDANGTIIRDEATGKIRLVRDGAPLVTLNNTVVHEMFHAFMDDYNRTGMLGAKNVEDGYTPGGKFVSETQQKIFNALVFPKWFREGTASAVENVYQFRYDVFQLFRVTRDNPTKIESEYTKGTLLYNYINGKEGSKDSYLDLEYAANANASIYENARYTTGYLATLYLSQLAAQKNASIGSAKNPDGSFSSEKLCLGLNSILERMHNGESLDAVIKDISTIENDPPMYSGTDDFASKYIKGAEQEDKTYLGDNASMAFTLDFLNYMNDLDNVQGNSFKPNGSILYDFNQDYNLAVDPAKTADADFYVVSGMNTYTPSTAPNSATFVSGGKSELPAEMTTASEPEQTVAEPPLAAKADSEQAAPDGATNQ